MKLGLVLAASCALGCSSAQPVSWNDNVGTPRNNCTSLDAGQTGQEGGPPANVWNQQASDWLQTQPKIHVVFWGKYWTYDGYQLFAYDSDVLQLILNDPSFYKPMQEYGINTGSLVGIHISNEGILAENIINDDIQSELLSEIGNGVLPAPDSSQNTMYVIMLPPNTPAADCNGGACSAYHRWASYNNVNFTYDVVEFDKTGGFVVISHEIYEAATDPTLHEFNGGWGEGEIGDLCGGQAYTLDGVQIQKLWSQNACQCIPTE